jgi:hypothetical protein
VVDEVVGKPLLSPKPHGHLSVFHDDALRLVHRLHELEDESERLSRQLVNDPNQSAELRVGSTLEATLADLRSLRIAEEELRQDIKQ